MNASAQFFRALFARRLEFVDSIVAMLARFIGLPTTAAPDHSLAPNGTPWRTPPVSDSTERIEIGAWWVAALSGVSLGCLWWLSAV